MKNKIFLRIFTLTLVLVLCLGAVACAKSNTDAETSETTAEETTAEITSNNGSGSGQSNVSSEETLFAELMAAYRASAEYSGAISFLATQKVASNADDEAYSMDVSSSTSMDPAKKLFFASIDADLSDGKYTDVEKIFAIDGEFYSYDRYVATSGEGDDEETYEYETYEKVPGGFDALEQSEYFAELVERFVGGIKKAESFAALKSAFTKTFKEIKDREKAELIEDGELAQDASFDLVPEVSIKRVSGEVVLTVVTRMSASALYDAGEITNNCSAVYTRTIACKNGKISGLDMSVIITGDVTEEDENGQEPPVAEPASLSESTDTKKIENRISVTYDIEYSFDQAGYDAIEVSLPEDPDEIGDGADEFTYVTVKFGEHEMFDTYFASYVSVEEFIESVHETAGYTLGYDSVYDETYGWIDVYNVTINGLYKDAALTQPITASTTREEILALDCIYADYSIRDGYAIVVESYDSIWELSLDYQIVLADPYGLLSVDISSKGGRAVNVSDPFVFDVDEDDDNEYNISVNGAAVTAESINLESSKIYDVKYVRVDTDKDVDMSILFIDMM